jgi:hypothetical protein
MKATILLLFLLAAPTRGQDRFQSGELKGFTKSPSEGEIVHLEQPFIVPYVGGVVVRAVGDKSPLEGALFEVRALTGSEVLRSAKTGPDGRFQIKALPAGKYLFKATALGFQSVVGEVVVSAKGGHRRAIKLQMLPGV